MKIQRKNELRGFIHSCLRERKDEGVWFYKDGNWSVDTPFAPTNGVYRTISALAKIHSGIKGSKIYRLNRSITLNLEEVEKRLDEGV